MTFYETEFIKVETNKLKGLMLRMRMKRPLYERGNGILCSKASKYEFLTINGCLYRCVKRVYNMCEASENPVKFC